MFSNFDRKHKHPEAMGNESNSRYSTLDQNEQHKPTRGDGTNTTQKSCGATQRQ